MIALGLSALPVSIDLSETTRNPVVASLALLRERTAETAGTVARFPRPQLPETSVREMVSVAPGSTYLSDQFPLARRAGPRSPEAIHLPPGIRPNIVFVLMEGVRAYEVGVYGGRVPGLTPNLDRLAQEGIRIDRAYSPGTHTPEGELGLWYGLLAVPHGLVLTDSPVIRSIGSRSHLPRWSSPSPVTIRSRFRRTHGLALRRRF